MKKRITLKGIANELNVSISTVSKSLKNSPEIGEETREKIIAFAKAHNYRPNNIALSLKNRKTKTIGVIIPEIVHYFFSSVINGIIAEAEKQDYLVIILQSNESKEMEKKQVELLMSKRVDGIIISLSNESNNDEHLETILQKDIPFVCSFVHGRAELVRIRSVKHNGCHNEQYGIDPGL